MTHRLVHRNARQVDWEVAIVYIDDASGSHQALKRAERFTRATRACGNTKPERASTQFQPRITNGFDTTFYNAQPLRYA